MPPQTLRPPRPRVVLYLRLSDSDDTSTSIARQEEDLRARAAREGWGVVAVLVDDGISGRKARKKADAALAMLRNHEADVLAVWKFDRWSRQGLPAVAALIETLEAVPDAFFIADRDGLDSRQPAWRIIAVVLAEIARQEAENTQLRVTSAIAKLRRDARFAGGTVPYGYRTAPAPDGPGRVLVLDRAEAAIVREIADRILSGEAPYRVCIDLNRRHVPAPRSEYRRLIREGRDTTKAGRGTWRVQSLRRLLTGRHILGQQIHHGEPLRGEDGLPVAVWAPVLALPDGAPDVQAWQSLRRRLLPARDGTPPAPRRRQARLLSGLVYCGACDGRLHVRVTPGTVSGKSYRCARKANGELCPSVSVSAGTLEEHVLARVVERVGAWPVVEERVFATVQGAEDLGEIEDAIQETTASLAADDADVPALLTRLEALKARRAEIRALPETTRTVLVPTGQTYAEALEAAEDDDARRAILEKVVIAVHVRKGKPGRRYLDPARVDIESRTDIPTDLAASSLLGAMLDGPEPARSVA
jgi:site-specific DNA recombinase